MSGFFDPQYLHAPVATVNWQTFAQVYGTPQLPYGNLGFPGQAGDDFTDVPPVPAYLKIDTNANAHASILAIGCTGTIAIVDTNGGDPDIPQNTVTVRQDFEGWMAQWGLTPMYVFTESGQNFMQFWKGAQAYGPVFPWHDDPDTAFGIALGIAASVVGASWVEAVGNGVVNDDPTGALIGVAEGAVGLSGEFDSSDVAIIDKGLSTAGTLIKQASAPKAAAPAVTSSPANPVSIPVAVASPAASATLPLALVPAPMTTDAAGPSLTSILLIVAIIAAIVYLERPAA